MVNWYCIHTKPKREDIISSRLTQFEDIELFNPKMKTKQYIKYRLLEVEQPLFPTYIFTRIDQYKYFHMIKYTRGVKYFVGDPSGNAYVVDNNIIDIIKSKIINGFVKMHDFTLNHGEKVIVMDGPFKGMSGLFLKETKPNERIMILLNMIESQIKLELPKELIARSASASPLTFGQQKTPSRT